MFVNGYSEMKRFIPALAMKGEPTQFDDALSVAQDDLVTEIIGEDLEARLEQRNEQDKRLLNICQRIVSVQAFLSTLHEMDLVLTDAGFGVVSNESVAPASKERIQNLKLSLQIRLDENKDRLVNTLMKSELYEDWRGTEEFARLSDGLILTFADFKDVAVLNSITKDAYPQTWSDFLKLNAALNVAFTSDVASYISPDYADEILEKIRDCETFLPNELKVIKQIKTAIAAIALGDRDTGITLAIKAAIFMKAHPEDFPTFMDSSTARADLTLTHSDTPLFYML